MILVARLFLRALYVSGLHGEEFHCMDVEKMRKTDARCDGEATFYE